MVLCVEGSIGPPCVDGLQVMRLGPCHARGRSAHRSSHIPATDHRIRFGLHPSKRGEKPAAFYLDSRGSTALKTSVFQSETEFLINARNFAPLIRGNASTIFSCWAALTRYDSPGRRSFIKKKAKSGATTRSRHSTRYSFPEIFQSLRWK